MGEATQIQTLGPGAADVERGILGAVRRGLDILRFRREAIGAAAADESTLAAALAIAALAGVAAAARFGLFVPAYLGYAIAYAAASLLFAGLIHVAAGMVPGARRDFLAFYRPFGHTYLVLWIASVPIVEAFFTVGLWLWQIAAAIFVAERVYRIDRVRAVAVVLVPAVAMLFATLVFNGAVAITALLGGWLF